MCTIIFLQEPVFVRNYAKGPKWTAGVIESVSGPVSYVVKLLNGLVWRHQLDQIRPRKSISLDNTFAESHTNETLTQVITLMRNCFKILMYQ